jgi:hypothetical protein
MRIPLRQTGRIVLLTSLLAVWFPEASLAGSNGKRSGPRQRLSYVFLLSSTPLANSRGG